jgi:hypothetical protein
MRLGMRSTLGMLLWGFAAMVLLGEVLALVDPVGTQMANDADPFGTPPGWREHATAFGVVAALSAGGWWLIFGGRPKHNPSTHQRSHG